MTCTPPRFAEQMRARVASGALAFTLCGFGALAPIDLAQYGFTGCTGYPDNFISFFSAILDINGTAPATVITIPNDPGLASVQMNCQMAALAPTAIEFTDVVVAMFGN